MMPKVQGLSAVYSFNACYSQALAQAALHEVSVIQPFLPQFLEELQRADILQDSFLFTKAGEPWLPTSIWALIELPALTVNEHMKRISRIDPRDTGPASDPGCAAAQIIWERGVDKPVEPPDGGAAKCQILEDY